MRRRGVAVLAAGALGAGALAGCGGGGGSAALPSDGAARGPSDESRIRELMARRAAAFSSGQAPPATTATPPQRSRDRRDARRMRRIGVRVVRFDVREVRVGGTRARARLSVDYRLEGVRGRFTADRRVVLRRTGGTWRVHAVRGVRRRPPWEVADFRRERSEHFAVLTPPGVDPAAGGLLTTLEAGYEQMRDLMVRGRLRRRYLVVVAADARQARALTADIRVGDLAALTDTEVREAPGRARRVQEVLGQRLLVVWPAFAAAGPEQGATVVIHELTHAVLAPLTSGRTPAWLTEGVALYVSGDLRAGEAARSVVDLAGLRSPTAIADLAGDQQSAAYAYSSAAAFHIAETYGEDRLLELYDVFNRPDVPSQAAAVRRVLGVSIGRLERELQAWIAAQAA